MCQTYFEIIVYKYFAIGCCKLCGIVCLLGPILLSYIIVLRQHFQLWSYSFFYDSKFLLFSFAICFVCLLFNAFSAPSFIRPILCRHLPEIRLPVAIAVATLALTLSISQSALVPSFLSLRRCIFFFNIVCLRQQYSRKIAVCMWPIRTIIRAIRLQTVWCCKPLNWLYNYCQDIFQAKIVKMAGAINFVDIEYSNNNRQKSEEE